MYRSQDLLRAPGQSHASDCLCDGHGRMPVKTASNERSTNNARTAATICTLFDPPFAALRHRRKRSRRGGWRWCCVGSPVSGYSLFIPLSIFLLLLSTNFFFFSPVLIPLVLPSFPL